MLPGGGGRQGGKGAGARAGGSKGCGGREAGSWGYGGSPTPTALEVLERQERRRSGVLPPQDPGSSHVPNVPLQST